MTPPLLIVVTGAPATGKTTVAEALAERLRVPLVTKDTLKETLYEFFDPGDEERLDAAALALLYAVVGLQLEAGVSVVAESNFEAESDTQPFHRLAERHEHRLVQVHCDRPPELVERKFAERAAEGRRHPGHGDRPEDAAEVRADLEAGRWDPLELPGETVEVDKDTVDFDELAERLLSG